MLRELKIIPLGGVEEIGFNATLIEYGNTQLLIDAGLGFPYGDLYGVDYIIPNISYIKKFKKNLSVFITHGHLDHIGGLPFILPELGYPTIYCSEFAKELILSQFERNNHDTSRLKIKIINKDFEGTIGELGIKTFAVNHSIPESMGVIIKSPQGNVIHTGDFKFDNTPDLGKVAEYDKIAIAGKDGVIALLSDSTNSFIPGHSLSEKEIYQNLLDIIKEANGRVIVSTFSSLVSRIFQLIKVAKETNRRILVLGRSMINIIEIAYKLKYLDIDRRIFVDVKTAKRIPGKNLMILATGAQGENMAALSRIIRGEHPHIKIKKGDSVVLSASVIPGNDLLVQNMVDELFQKGASVYRGSSELDLHTSGHGYQEDQKLMLNLVKPKYFIPVHGFQSFLYKHAQTAQKIGMAESNIIIPKRGEIISIAGGQIKKAGHVNAHPIFVSGKGVGDVGTIILSERQRMANSGVLIISLLISKQGKKLVEAPLIYMKGLVFAKDNTKLLFDIGKLITNVIVKTAGRNLLEQDFKMRIVDSAQKYVFEKTGKDPLIIPIINFV